MSLSRLRGASSCPSNVPSFLAVVTAVGAVRPMEKYVSQLHLLIGVANDMRDVGWWSLGVPLEKSAPLPVPLFLLPGRGRDGQVGATRLGLWVRKMVGVWILHHCGVSTPAQHCFLPDIFMQEKKKCLSWLKQGYLGFLLYTAASKFELCIEGF